MRISRRIHLLPDGLRVEILRCRGAGSVDVVELRAACQAAELYILVGPQLDPATGVQLGVTAIYVGESAVLTAQRTRVGVSIDHWVTRNGQLEPRAVVLVSRVGKPWTQSQRWLLECHLCRQLSGAWSLLNVRTAAPAATRRLSRRQRLHVLATADRLAGLLRGRLLRYHPTGAVGGSTREQLIRLIVASDQAWDVSQLVHAAAASGIRIGGATCSQSARRDASTRERDSSGAPRVRQCWIGGNGKAVFYPAARSRQWARKNYRPDRGTSWHGQPQNDEMPF
jgi:hypothetical protein